MAAHGEVVVEEEEEEEGRARLYWAESFFLLSLNFSGIRCLVIGVREKEKQTQKKNYESTNDKGILSREGKATPRSIFRMIL